MDQEPTSKNPDGTDSTDRSGEPCWEASLEQLDSSPSSELEAAGGASNGALPAPDNFEGQPDRVGSFDNGDTTSPSNAVSLSADSGVQRSDPSAAPTSGETKPSHHHPKGKLKRLPRPLQPDRECACGCGGSLTGRRPQTKWVNEACRQRDARRRTGATVPADRDSTLERGDAGTVEWCAFHGFTQLVLRRHGVERYSSTSAEKIKLLYPDYTNKGVITRVVGQSGGLKMPKFPLPEHEPIPVQLDPDEPVVTDPRVTWHRHDRLRSRTKTALRKHGGQAIGYEISQALAEPHIFRGRSETPYDRESGEGDHHGVNVLGLHAHAPRRAKYVNFGDNKRIDCGPRGLEPWRAAERAAFILEGKKKHLAAEANGWPAVSVLSITMWDRREVRWLARWIRENNPHLTVYVVPDGDWMNFERNDGAVFRQATYLINELRARGLEACMLTTFVPEDGHVCECDVKELLRKELPLERISGGLCRYCGGYLKALDDWYGAGGTTDDLVVVSRYEPADRITEYVLGLPIHGNARPGRVRALRALSLHDRDGCDLLNVPLKTMQRITGARRPQDVPLILADLSRALEIEGGLELEKRDYMRDDHSIGEAWDWKVRPRIAVKREFRATERSMNLGRFKMQTTSPTVAERIKHVEEQLERQKRDIEELARQVGITFDDEAVTEAVERLLEDLD